MKRSMNQKGFTLIEILAAITILGILMSIAIVGINGVLDNAKKQYYVSAVKEMKLAGQSYFQDNRNKLPKAIGRKSTVSLQELYNAKYIEQIVDYKKVPCSATDSSVQVFMYNKNDYSYIANLYCDNDRDVILEAPKPKFNIVMTTDSANIKNAELKFDIYPGTNDNYQDAVLMSYSYKIYKGGKEIYSSGNINAKYAKEIHKTVKLNKYTPGTLKVKVTATNSYGMSASDTGKQSYADNQAPECTVIDPIPAKTASWINANREIKVSCDDGNGSGCKRDVYSYVYKKDARTKDLYVYDMEGNKGTCKDVVIYVDKSVPQCTLDATLTKISIKTKTDSLSGIKSYGMGTTSTADYNSKTEIELSHGTIYAYVKDNVDLTNKCSIKVNKLNYNVSTNKGSAVNPTFKLVPVGVGYGTLPDSTKAGYEFLGWYTSSSNGSKVTKTTKMGDKDTTIYSQFKICPAGKYSSGTKCVACPDGYKNSVEGSSAVSQCYRNVPGGKYIATAKNTTDSTCAAKTYKGKHKVYYGQTSSCDSCPNGYTNSAAGSDTITKCYRNVSAGKYMGTFYGLSDSNCGAGTYKIAHKVYYGSKSACDKCPSGYRNGSGATAESNCIKSVSAGKHVATAKASDSNCGTGTYKGAHSVKYGSTSACINCPSGYRKGAGTTEESNCIKSVSAGKHVKTARGKAVDCGTGETSDAHNVKYGGTSNCRVTCSLDNPTGCPSNHWHACRKGNTHVYKSDDMTYYASPDTVPDTTYFTVLDDAGSKWKIKIPDRDTEVWIYSKCVGTSNEYCTFDRCPDLGK